MSKKSPLKDMIRKGFPEGFPFPAELGMLCDWVDKNNSPISGYFRMFVDEDKDAITYWMGFDNVNQYLGVFGSTPDGSMYALWKDDRDNSCKVVHLGSEGENLFILANNFVDFLRLLAIGYDEIGNCDLTVPPQENEGYDEDMVNPQFTEWVRTTFNVTIPQTGDAIVNIYDKSFDNWVQEQLAEYS